MPCPLLVLLLLAWPASVAPSPLSSFCPSHAIVGAAPLPSGLSIKLALLSLLAAAALVRGAVNLDGSRASPLLSDDDPAPISDPLTYVPEQYDCPLPCQAAYANVHKWTPYYSADRLRRCELPVLLYFSVLLPLDDPDTDVLIRSCTIGADPASAGDRTVRKATSMTIENPKLGAGLFEPSVSLAPACAIDGREMSGTLALSASGGGGLSSGAGAQALLDGMKSFWSAKDNCDEGFLFAYDKQTVAGVYISAGIGKKTAVSALGALAGRL